MILIKKPCNIKGRRYEIGKEFKPKKCDMPLINVINEKGFIKPLTKNELLELSNSFNLAKKTKRKEENK